ncbi:hypothetical protein OAG68_02805 [bacterium]|nr:hypothetical protein [bacterium]
MKTQPQGKHTILILIAVALAAGAVYFLCNQGYGKVSRRTYDMATAIYGACLARSENRVDKIQQLLSQDTAETSDMSIRERKWLNNIIQKAKNGNWESAAKAAKRIMEDQVVR